MVPSLLKRIASRSPDGGRPSKFLATSSPEEGELDDATTSAAHSNALPSSLPVKPVSLKPKVPFPFKKKPESVTTESSTGGLDAGVPPGEDDEPRAREGGGAGGRKNGRAQKHGTSDHWEPNNYARGEGRRYASRRDYPPRDHRDRGRASLSPNRSRSASPSYREKHRLPPPRSPEPGFSPPRRDYGVDRIRDRERDRGEVWDRDRDERRYRDDDDDRHYSRREAPIHGDGPDRYYRPGPPPPRRGDNRSWVRRDDNYDLDRRNRVDGRFQDRDYDRGRRQDNYRPTSPQSPVYSDPSALSPAPARIPPIPSPARTPPPPTSSPPPPPPPDLRLENTQQLPIQQATVTVAMKRPGAPRDDHSPTPLKLPEAKPVANGVERGKEREREKKVSEEVRVKYVKRPTPVRRSRKEEVLAYGRAFEGCGMQSDYSVTTKLGEGTFGEVHKAIQKATGTAVALKRILMHNEKEGMPVTALREIKILKALKHPCIVDILDMFVVPSSSKDPLSVYMVFPYMDHDLAGLLENERVKLQPSHIKLYMKQLLEGTEYMHRNHILHRDMKAANLLISNSGSLRIADFGLARAFDANVSRGTGVSDYRGRERKYTNCVVTRWYRPPELLLGARQYGGEVDLWGIGCVLGEMFSRRPILPGTSDLDQLEKIWQLCGTPNQHTWPNFDALPGCEGVKRFGTTQSRRLKQAYESVGPETCDLLDKLLTCNPRERITASQALDHDYFWTDPLPADPKTLPSYEASHEFDKRGHRNQHPPPGIIPPIIAVPPPTGGPPSQPPLHFSRGPYPPQHHGPPMLPPLPLMPPYGPPPPGHGPHSHPPTHPHGFPPPPHYPPPHSSHHSQSHPHSHSSGPGRGRGVPYGGGGGGGRPGPYPPPPYHHPHQNGGRQGAPMGQGPPRGDRGGDRWEPRGRPLPAHLPPRPPPPLAQDRYGGGGGGGGDRAGGDKASGGDGGGGKGGSVGSATELNYG